MKYGFSKTTDYTFEQAIAKVTEELKKEGFGVLTTIDVKETLKKKIDVDFKKYTILGACNPKLAHGGLQAEEELGLLLPCNVIVYEKNDKTIVSVFDPQIMTLVIENPNIKPIAEEVKNKLQRVLEAV
ncbi:MAG TPA: ABC transporter ATP-binding protein [Ignavibacteriales bacterium]|nr:ABC transporter ATP-binding protein [Ignavibacteriales bacterium]